jgi:hypothetical protein
MYTVEMTNALSFSFFIFWHLIALNSKKGLSQLNTLSHAQTQHPNG